MFVLALSDVSAVVLIAMAKVMQKNIPSYERNLYAQILTEQHPKNQDVVSLVHKKGQRGN